MTLASHCLGEARREWSLAMEGEFEAAMRAGKPLRFALGCLIAACREMPRHAEGRLALASHGLALGFMIPVAALQLLCASGYVFPQNGGFFEVPALSRAQAVYGSYAYLRATPVLLGLWLLLALWHCRLAWHFLEGNWQAVVRSCALIAAGSITLLIFTAILAANDARPALQAATLAFELVAIAVTARWRIRLNAQRSPFQLA